MDVTASTLHVIQVGGGTSGDLTALGERLQLTISRFATGQSQPAWSSLADGLNREIDETSGWVLLLRAGESVSRDLTGEISRVVSSEAPSAWAYRVRTIPFYCGGPLERRRRSDGEIRLFHPRRARFLPKGEEKVLQSRGTVIRLDSPLIRDLYDSVAEHRNHLERIGTRKRLPTRFVDFLSRLAKTPWGLNRRAVRFHWMEAGWDRESATREP
ncbi:MAG: hypothetical protein R3338_01935 [Thermoanaerobaculia bacterium]|nr:hypothetical protein [Thermoanaerobaculia bacterium]